MTRRRQLAICGCVAASWTGPAWSQPVQGPYVDIGAGYNLLVDIHAHTRDPELDVGRSNYRFGDGFVGAGSVGWGFGNGLRAEVEGAYDYNAVINRVHEPIAEANGGHQNTYGVLANLFYDLDLNKVGIPVDWVQPYVGVGAGVLWTHFSPLTSATVDRSNVFNLGGTGENFSYQGIVGFGFPIKAVPGLKLTTDYRFIGIDIRSGAVGTNYSAAGIKTGTADLSPAFLQQFTVSVAYAFEHPSPPPPAGPAPMAAPAPQAARSYLVFFDWDRASLSPRAREIVADAAQNASRTATTTIEVDGYADTSHASTASRGRAYNLRLSEARASSVAHELIRDGIAQNEISVHAYGDTHLLVPTGPDAREPQNRRVEIVLRG